MRYKEKDGKLIFSDEDKKYNNLKDRETAIDKQLDDNKNVAVEVLKEAEDKGQAIVDASDDPEDTQKNLDAVLEGLESGAQTGTIQLNKGGLMSKGKKKK